VINPIFLKYNSKNHKTTPSGNFSTLFKHGKGVSYLDQIQPKLHSYEEIGGPASSKP